MTELSTGTLGLIACSTAANMALSAQSLRSLQKQTNLLEQMVTSLQAEKWRQDEKKILEMMHFGFSVVVPENQKFYLRQDIATEVIPLDQALRDKNKILIMSGEYFHKNQIVFDESKTILAEPGTVINVELNNRWQKVSLRLKFLTISSFLSDFCYERLAR